MAMMSTSTYLTRAGEVQGDNSGLRLRRNARMESLTPLSVQQGRSECGHRSVLLVREEAERLRTKLADFFSILLTPIRQR